MKKILGILILIAGIVIAVSASSANFAYFEATRNVTVTVVPDDNELIDLKPLQPYAYINSNGEMVLQLSDTNTNWPGHIANPNYNATWAEMEYGTGVSPDSIYVFEEVFEVSNHLWEDVDICVKVTYSGDGGILFFTGDYVEGAGQTSLQFTVPHGEAVKVGMVLDSSGLVEGQGINGDLQFTADNGECED
ncbi:hypothetical protein OCC_12771 [Thermococcus litoralis DSM 5473]|uniref:DUF1102 domain-containing protein n=1 Tax=Thermococcus litoralis (strain ATCC 51850 / DSM 5473 / JCM 8560 / NS-C) TaxID=523849 RepID=H3ZP41_THELN|nr:DUF1102 domain-containing protein [Thermococcus litoralis]EHR78278.1 hypothetical protein OCC_12771 [Thermococcus litoralis DSM 5473]